MAKILVSKYDDDGHYWDEWSVDDFINAQVDDGDTQLLGQLFNLLYDKGVITASDLDSLTVYDVKDIS